MQLPNFNINRTYTVWIVLSVFGILLLASGYFLIQGMKANSLAHATQDLDLVLKLTGVIIIFLLGAGWFFDRQSLKRELKNANADQQDELKQTWRNNYWQGISTELVGAAITAFLFGVILLTFQQYQSIEDSKADLILQMGSPDHAFAIEAVRIATQKGWDSDGTLHGAFLVTANLKDAKFWGADLEQAHLRYANLEHSKLWTTNLKGAVLVSANLEGAELYGSNLAGADLRYANVDGVGWSYHFTDRKQPSIAWLPDGTLWKPETDMKRFTDPNHPDFRDTLLKINEIRLEMGLFMLNSTNDYPPPDCSC